MNTFYITTPIYYPNGPPHIGHAYTTVYADVLARFARLLEKDVFFLTGNDEHGLKIQRFAEKLGKTPKEVVDEMATVYRDYWLRLNISYDYFIRTTDSVHEKVVMDSFRKLYEKGYVYKDKYGGFYCVECEKYYLPGEYVEVEGKPYCPIHNKPLEYLEEETYYFKLSEFKDFLLQVLRNDKIVYPEEYSLEVTSRIEKEGLRDISIARPVERVSWGVKVPFDPSYVIYVWFDALLNYITGAGYATDPSRFEKYWVNVHHVVGKDILWFHTAVWFSILKALDIPLPKKVLVHAFLINKGLKIGKSAGNVISIDDLLSRYNGPDGVRYILSRVFNMSKDSEVSFELMDAIYNDELADTYGNLVRRVGALAMKKLKGKIYRREVDKKLNEQITLRLNTYLERMGNYDVPGAIIEIMELLREGNAYVNNTRPWEKEDPSKELYSLLELIRVSTIALAPVIPNAASKVAEEFGFRIENPARVQLGVLERYNIRNAPILFKKVMPQRST
ncbi:methionine--tRNA ligase [Thermosphaera chiliense]|uniref:methionine--tRNA ligase n=1 Tax=Thermosphaera chiliense TaxID=3402707 RepID=A0A7M1UPK4_9CREN|nr:methionine--tRNA ligase [Thermosphaera aggregans]QOR94026.1 methionine--tRNA ligase [Thermosphaera aggregans]